MTPSVWTIGHSTRDLGDFLSLLAASGIGLVADIRQFPGSKRYPHFNREALEGTLGRVGIAYWHVGELGGRAGGARLSGCV